MQARHAAGLPTTADDLRILTDPGLDVIGDGKLKISLTRFTELTTSLRENLPTPTDGTPHPLDTQLKALDAEATVRHTVLNSPESLTRLDDKLTNLHASEVSPAELQRITDLAINRLNTQNKAALRPAVDTTKAQLLVLRSKSVFRQSLDQPGRTDEQTIAAVHAHLTDLANANVMYYSTGLGTPEGEDRIRDAALTSLDTLPDPEADTQAGSHYDKMVMFASDEIMERLSGLPYKDAVLEKRLRLLTSYLERLDDPDDDQNVVTAAELDELFIQWQNAAAKYAPTTYPHPASTAWYTRHTLINPTTTADVEQFVNDLWTHGRKAHSTGTMPTADLRRALDWIQHNPGNIPLMTPAVRVRAELLQARIDLDTGAPLGPRINETTNAIALQGYSLVTKGFLTVAELTELIDEAGANLGRPPRNDSEAVIQARLDVATTDIAMATLPPTGPLSASDKGVQTDRYNALTSSVVLPVVQLRQKLDELRATVRDDQHDLRDQIDIFASDLAFTRENQRTYTPEQIRARIQVIGPSTRVARRDKQFDFFTPEIQSLVKFAEQTSSDLRHEVIQQTYPQMLETITDISLDPDVNSSPQRKTLTERLTLISTYGLPLVETGLMTPAQLATVTAKITQTDQTPQPAGLDLATEELPGVASQMDLLATTAEFMAPREGRRTPSEITARLDYLKTLSTPTDNRPVPPGFDEAAAHLASLPEVDEQTRVDIGLMRAEVMLRTANTFDGYLPAFTLLREISGPALTTGRAAQVAALLEDLATRTTLLKNLAARTGQSADTPQWISAIQAEITALTLTDATGIDTLLDQMTKLTSLVRTGDTPKTHWDALLDHAVQLFNDLPEDQRIVERSVPLSELRFAGEDNAAVHKLLTVDIPSVWSGELSVNEYTTDKDDVLESIEGTDTSGEAIESIRNTIDRRMMQQGELMMFRRHLMSDQAQRHVLLTRYQTLQRVDSFATSSEAHVTDQFRVLAAAMKEIDPQLFNLELASIALTVNGFEFHALADLTTEHLMKRMQDLDELGDRLINVINHNDLGPEVLFTTIEKLRDSAADVEEHTSDITDEHDRDQIKQKITQFLESLKEHELDGDQLGLDQLDLDDTNSDDGSSSTDGAAAMQGTTPTRKTRNAPADNTNQDPALDASAMAVDARPEITQQDSSIADDADGSVSYPGTALEATLSFDVGRADQVVDRMERAGLLSEVTSGVETTSGVYVLDVQLAKQAISGFGPRSARGNAFLAALADRNHRMILESLRGGGVITPAGVYPVLGISPDSVAIDKVISGLDQLVNAGLLAKNPDGQGYSLAVSQLPPPAVLANDVLFAALNSADDMKVLGKMMRAAGNSLNRADLAALLGASEPSVPITLSTKDQRALDTVAAKIATTMIERHRDGRPLPAVTVFGLGDKVSGRGAAAAEFTRNDLAFKIAQHLDTSRMELGLSPEQWLSMDGLDLSFSTHSKGRPGRLEVVVEGNSTVAGARGRADAETLFAAGNIVLAEFETINRLALQLAQSAIKRQSLGPTRPIDVTVTIHNDGTPLTTARDNAIKSELEYFVTENLRHLQNRVSPDQRVTLDAININVVPDAKAAPDQVQFAVDWELTRPEGYVAPTPPVGRRTTDDLISFTSDTTSVQQPGDGILEDKSWLHSTKSFDHPDAGWATIANPVTGAQIDQVRHRFPARKVITETATFARDAKLTKHQGSALQIDGEPIDLEIGYEVRDVLVKRSDGTIQPVTDLTFRYFIDNADEYTDAEIAGLHKLIQRSVDTKVNQRNFGLPDGTQLHTRIEFTNDPRLQTGEFSVIKKGRPNQRNIPLHDEQIVYVHELFGHAVGLDDAYIETDANGPLFLRPARDVKTKTGAQAMVTDKDGQPRPHRPITGGVVRDKGFMAHDMRAENSSIQPRDLFRLKEILDSFAAPAAPTLHSVLAPPARRAILEALRGGHSVDQQALQTQLNLPAVEIEPLVNDLTAAGLITQTAPRTYQLTHDVALPPTEVLGNDALYTALNHIPTATALTEMAREKHGGRLDKTTLDTILSPAELGTLLELDLINGPHPGAIYTLNTTLLDQAITLFRDTPPSHDPNATSTAGPQRRTRDKVRPTPYPRPEHHEVPTVVDDAMEIDDRASSGSGGDTRTRRNAPIGRLQHSFAAETVQFDEGLVDLPAAEVTKLNALAATAAVSAVQNFDNGERRPTLDIIAHDTLGDGTADLQADAAADVLYEQIQHNLDSLPLGERLLAKDVIDINVWTDFANAPHSVDITLTEPSAQSPDPTLTSIQFDDFSNSLNQDHEQDLLSAATSIARKAMFENRAGRPKPQLVITVNGDNDIGLARQQGRSVLTKIKDLIRDELVNLQLDVPDAYRMKLQDVVDPTYQTTPHGIHGQVDLALHTAPQVQVHPFTPTPKSDRIRNQRAPHALLDFAPGTDTLTLLNKRKLASLATQLAETAIERNERNTKPREAGDRFDRTPRRTYQPPTVTLTGESDALNLTLAHLDDLILAASGDLPETALPIIELSPTSAPTHSVRIDVDWDTTSTPNFIDPNSTPPNDTTSEPWTGPNRGEIPTPDKSPEAVVGKSARQIEEKPSTLSKADQILNDESWRHASSNPTHPSYKEAPWFEPADNPIDVKKLQHLRTLLDVTYPMDVKTQQDLRANPYVTSVFSEENQVTQKSTITPGVDDPGHVYLKVYGGEIGFDHQILTDTSGNKVEVFTIKHYTPKPDFMTLEELKEAQFKAQQAVDEYFNKGYRFPDGNQIHVQLEFVDHPDKTPHEPVHFQPEGSRLANTANIPLDRPLDTWAHELAGHPLGLFDEYVKPIAGNRPVFMQPPPLTTEKTDGGRKGGQGRAVFDHGLMAMYKSDTKFTPRNAWQLKNIVLALANNLEATPWREPDTSTSSKRKFTDDFDQSDTGSTKQKLELRNAPETGSNSTSKTKVPNFPTTDRNEPAGKAPTAPQIVLNDGQNPDRQRNSEPGNGLLQTIDLPPFLQDGKALGTAVVMDVTGAPEVRATVEALLPHSAGVTPVGLEAIETAVGKDFESLLGKGRKFPVKMGKNWFEATVSAALLPPADEAAAITPIAGHLSEHSVEATKSTSTTTTAAKSGSVGASAFVSTTVGPYGALAASAALATPVVSVTTRTATTDERTLEPGKGSDLVDLPVAYEISLTDANGRQIGTTADMDGSVTLRITDEMKTITPPSSGQVEIQPPDGWGKKLTYFVPEAITDVNIAFDDIAAQMHPSLTKVGAPGRTDLQHFLSPENIRTEFGSMLQGWVYSSPLVSPHGSRLGMSRMRAVPITAELVGTNDSINMEIHAKSSKRSDLSSTITTGFDINASAGGGLGVSVTPAGGTAGLTAGYSSQTADTANSGVVSEKKSVMKTKGETGLYKIAMNIEAQVPGGPLHVGTATAYVRLGTPEAAAAGLPTPDGTTPYVTAPATQPRFEPPYLASLLAGGHVKIGEFTGADQVLPQIEEALRAMPGLEGFLPDFADPNLSKKNAATLAVLMNNQRMLSTELSPTNMLTQPDTLLGPGIQIQLKSQGLTTNDFVNISVKAKLDNGAHLGKVDGRTVEDRNRFGPSLGSSSSTSKGWSAGVEAKVTVPAKPGSATITPSPSVSAKYSSTTTTTTTASPMIDNITRSANVSQAEVFQHDVTFDVEITAHSRNRAWVRRLTPGSPFDTTPTVKTFAKTSDPGVPHPLPPIEGRATLYVPTGATTTTDPSAFAPGMPSVEPMPANGPRSIRELLDNNLQPPGEITAKDWLTTDAVVGAEAVADEAIALLTKASGGDPSLTLPGGTARHQIDRFFSPDNLKTSLPELVNHGMQQGGLRYDRRIATRVGAIGMSIGLSNPRLVSTADDIKVADIYGGGYLVGDRTTTTTGVAFNAGLNTSVRPSSDAPGSTVIGVNSKVKGWSTSRTTGSDIDSSLQRRVYTSPTGRTFLVQLDADVQLVAESRNQNVVHTPAPESAGSVVHLPGGVFVRVSEDQARNLGLLPPLPPRPVTNLGTMGAPATLRPGQPSSLGMGVIETDLDLTAMVSPLRDDLGKLGTKLVPASVLDDSMNNLQRLIHLTTGTSVKSLVDSALDGGISLLAHQPGTFTKDSYQVVLRAKLTGDPEFKDVVNDGGYSMYNLFGSNQNTIATTKESSSNIGVRLAGTGNPATGDPNLFGGTGATASASLGNTQSTSVSKTNTEVALNARVAFGPAARFDLPIEFELVVLQGDKTLASVTSQPQRVTVRSFADNLTVAPTTPTTGTTAPYAVETRTLRPSEATAAAISSWRQDTETLPPSASPEGLRGARELRYAAVAALSAAGAPGGITDNGTPSANALFSALSTENVLPHLPAMLSPDGLTLPRLHDSSLLSDRHADVKIYAKITKPKLSALSDNVLPLDGAWTENFSTVTTKYSENAGLGASAPTGLVASKTPDVIAGTGGAEFNQGTDSAKAVTTGTSTAKVLIDFFDGRTGLVGYDIEFRVVAKIGDKTGVAEISLPESASFRIGAPELDAAFASPIPLSVGDAQSAVQAAATEWRAAEEVAYTQRHDVEGTINEISAQKESAAITSGERFTEFAQAENALAAARADHNEALAGFVDARYAEQVAGTELERRDADLAAKVAEYDRLVEEVAAADELVVHRATEFDRSQTTVNQARAAVAAAEQELAGHQATGTDDARASQLAEALKQANQDATTKAARLRTAEYELVEAEQAFATLSTTKEQAADRLVKALSNRDSAADKLAAATEDAEQAGIKVGGSEQTLQDAIDDLDSAQQRLDEADKVVWDLHKQVSATHQQVLEAYAAADSAQSNWWQAKAELDQEITNFNDTKGKGNAVPPAATADPSITDGKVPNFPGGRSPDKANPDEPGLDEAGETGTTNLSQRMRDLDLDTAPTATAADAAALAQFRRLYNELNAWQNVQPHHAKIIFQGLRNGTPHSNITAATAATTETIALYRQFMTRFGLLDNQPTTTTTTTTADTRPKRVRESDDNPGTSTDGDTRNVRARTDTGPQQPLTQLTLDNGQTNLDQQHLETLTHTARDIAHDTLTRHHTGLPPTPITITTTNPTLAATILNHLNQTITHHLNNNQTTTPPQHRLTTNPPITTTITSPTPGPNTATITIPTNTTFTPTPTPNTLTTNTNPTTSTTLPGSTLELQLPASRRGILSDWS